MLKNMDLYMVIENITENLDDALKIVDDQVKEIEELHELLSQQ